MLALQRSAGNAAVAGLVARGAAPVRLLQRAVIAMDGATDTLEARRATRACLWNLTNRKTVAPGVAAPAPVRGRVVGPPDLAPFTHANVAGALPAERQAFLADGTLYILAHGGLTESPGRWAVTVGGLMPGEMADALVGWFGDVSFSGKIKLVACISAATAFPAIGAFAVTYAEALAAALRRRGAARLFRPSSVDGIVGVGWISEQTGEILSYDVAATLAVPQGARDAAFGHSFAAGAAGAGPRAAAIGGLAGMPAALTGRVGPAPAKTRYPVF